jgi:anti-sigma regulatory factor (Ser/Thr protein kinase)
MLPMTMNDNQPAQRWQMDFTSDPKCVSLVRHQVAKAMTGWRCSPEDVDRAVLISSELATNAIQHGLRTGGRFAVGVSIDSSGCLIEVCDSGTGVPRPVTASTYDEHGRGLALIALLADGAGCRPDEKCGKTVWARLALGPDPFSGLSSAERTAANEYPQQPPR